MISISGACLSAHVILCTFHRCASCFERISEHEKFEVPEKTNSTIAIAGIAVTFQSILSRAVDLYHINIHFERS